MKKYLKYTIESLKTGGFKLFFISLKYFLFKKVPNKNIEINNSEMGLYLCRENTTDFMYSFFNYEYKIKTSIKSVIRDYDAFIDIGACIGDYSIWLSKNNLKCIAFEPNKDNYNCMTNNIKINYLEKSIKTFNYGLGSKSEKVIFQTHPNNKGYSGKYARFKDSIKHEVEIKVFDDIFETLDLNYKQAIIMKIDAEGMEAEIIAGAKKFFSNARKILLIFEAHTRADETLNELKKITSIQLLDLDELNIGVFINNNNTK